MKEEKHWTSELLILFGIWLWERKEYGHALLCIHGPIWGYRIGQQLKITWLDVMHMEYDLLNHEIDNWDIDDTIRPINGLCYDYLGLLISKVDIVNDYDSIYMNYKTGRPLTTSTLKRELQKFSDEFLKELGQEVDIDFKLKPLKSSSFQIAWGIKLLERYGYSKKCFISLSKFMGHRTLKDTIKVFDMEPMDTIVYNFNAPCTIDDMNSNILKDKKQLRNIIDGVEYDNYTIFKRSIANQ